MYLAIKNQIFNRHSMPLSVRKMSRRITDKRQNQVSESIVRPLRHSQKGQFSLTGRGGWYQCDKNTINSRETEILASKSTYHSFHAFLWSMDHTQKMTFQYI